MSEGPTICDLCDHVEPQSRKGYVRGWLCLQHPKLPGFDGFVSGKIWEKDEPYLRCVNVNGGNCRLYKPARTPQMEMAMEKTDV